MSNLNPKQFPELFHGSTAETMKPGTIIRPGNDRVVWAGTNPERAADHVIDRMNTGYRGRDNKKGWHQQSLVSPVYEVEPLKTDKTLTDMSWWSKDSITSDKGFRVKGVKRYVTRGEKMSDE
jgi:hypothetical protein